MKLAFMEIRLRKHRAAAEAPDTLREDRCKCLASIMMCDLSMKIVIPTDEEWHGLNMMERDDELKRRYNA